MAIYFIEHPNTRYFEGDCPIFAIALHRLTGRSLGALLEHDGTRDVLIHAFVLLDESGAILDASGVSSIEDVLAEFPHNGGAILCHVDEDELMNIGYGANAPSVVDDDVLAAAMAVVEEHQYDIPVQMEASPMRL